MFSVGKKSQRSAFSFEVVIEEETTLRCQISLIAKKRARENNLGVGVRWWR